MKAMVDPYDGLVSFRKAYAAGEVATEPGRVHSDLLVHMDTPNGVMRLTYAAMDNGEVKALVMFVLADPIDEVTCFGVGYAVEERYRNNGAATKTLEKAIDELSNGMRQHLPAFYLEAVVGVDNVASQKVAARVLSATPTPGTDKVSGQPALAYVRLVKTR